MRRCICIFLFESYGGRWDGLACLVERLTKMATAKGRLNAPAVKAAYLVRISHGSDEFRSCWSGLGADISLDLVVEIP